MMANAVKLNKILNWSKRKPVTDKEWAEDVKAESLHIKHDYQLESMHKLLLKKLPSLEIKQRMANKYPDAIRKEVEENLLSVYSAGKEIDLEGLTQGEYIEKETQDRIAYFNWKTEKIKQSIERIEKEIDLRKRTAVKRTPIGTTYYIDFDNGNDGNTGTSTGQAWATLDQFTENTRSAGDKAIVRRGMTQTVTSDLTFTSSGYVYNPIKIEADFDDAWGDFSDSAQTYTLTWGSKTLTASATITGISAGDWIYNSTDGDDPREYAYEVASVSGTTLTLYLPFRGSTGSGKTLKVMPAAPIWNTASGNYQLDLYNDNNWEFQGMHFRGTDTYGIARTRAVAVYKDCIFTAYNSGDTCILTTDDGFATAIKCRFYNYDTGTGKTYGAPRGLYKYCLFDSNNAVTYPAGVDTYDATQVELIECEFQNNYKDIDTPSISPNLVYARVRARNCKFSGSNAYVSIGPEELMEFGIEDYNNTANDNRFYKLPSTNGDNPIFQTETTIVRSGGGATSIKVTPTTYIAQKENAKVLLFEYPIYADTSTKTYTAYFKSSGTANWTANPTADELWIEIEFWGDATNKYRKIAKSTGTCDFAGDDTTWHSLTVSATPAIAGVAYLRCYYAKTKEASKSNIFYADTKIEIT